MIYLLFQDSFELALFHYVCDLVTGLVLRFTFFQALLLKLICFTCGLVTS